MDEIAVGGMDLGHLETGLDRADGGGSKRIDDGGNIGDGQLMRRGVAGMEGDRTGRNGLPPSRVRGNHAAA